MMETSRLTILVIFSMFVLGCGTSPAGDADAAEDAGAHEDTSPKQDIGPEEDVEHHGDTDEDTDAPERICPPDEPPASFGRTCTADGECDGYLVCQEQSCGWPPAMTGDADDASTTVEIAGADTSVTVLAEVAESDLARTRGLAHRPCMQPGWAMLFIHPDEEELRYTVEEMRFAIDLIFADTAGRVVSVHRDLLPGSTETISSGVPARYALELPAGELADAGIGEPLEIVAQ